jgi:hypothetical protein
MAPLCEYEVKWLRECAGETQTDLIAGAAMWEALGSLRRAGLVSALNDGQCDRYEETPAGREYLAQLPSDA